MYLQLYMQPRETLLMNFTWSNKQTLLPYYIYLRFEKPYIPEMRTTVNSVLFYKITIGTSEYFAIFNFP